MPRYWATPEGLAVAAAAAGVVTLLLYGNSVDGALVWDDVPALVDNRDVRGGPGNPIVALLWRDFWGFDLHSSISHKVRPLVQLHQHPACACRILRPGRWAVGSNRTLQDPSLHSPRLPLLTIDARAS
jgi:hypothetical protein